MQQPLRLRRQAFLQVWKEFCPFTVDLMASPSNVQRDAEGIVLTFVSQLNMALAVFQTTWGPTPSVKECHIASHHSQ